MDFERYYPMGNLALFTMESSDLPYLIHISRFCDISVRKIFSKWGFCFIVSWIVKMAQHLQIDKIYHRKEQKIFYLVVYLVDLGKKSPGST